MNLNPLSTAALFSATLLSTCLFSASAAAEVLTFDDVGDAGAIPLDTYGGFTWSNTYVVNGGSVHPGSGYENGAVSGEYTALNAYGSTSSTTGEIFDFNGAYFTSAWEENNELTLSGFTGGVLQGSLTVVLNTVTPLWVAADFLGIDTLVFSTSDYQFAMDNFTFTARASAVPELSASGATSALFLMAGLLLLMTARRREAFAT